MWLVILQEPALSGESLRLTYYASPKRIFLALVRLGARVSSMVLV